MPLYNPPLITPITVPSGGTGLATLTANNVILGNGASSPTFVAPGSNGNVLTSNGTTWTSAAGGGGGTVVNARYHSATGTITGSLSNISYTTADFDSNSAYSGATYTIPTTGKYEIRAQVAINISIYAVGDLAIIAILKNGALLSQSRCQQAAIVGASAIFSPQISDLMSFTATDTVVIQASCNNGGTISVASSTTLNFFSINYVST